MFAYTLIHVWSPIYDFCCLFLFRWKLLTTILKEQYLYLADNVNNQKQIMRKNKTDSAIFQIMLYLIMTSLLCFFMNNTVLGLSAYKGKLFTDSNQMQTKLTNKQNKKNPKNIAEKTKSNTEEYNLKIPLETCSRKHTQIVLLENNWISWRLFYILVLYLLIIA